MKIYELEPVIEKSEVVKVAYYAYEDEIVLYKGPFEDMPLKYANMSFTYFAPHAGSSLCCEFMVPSYEAC